MTGQEAIAYIHTYHWQEAAPGLDRMRRLLSALGEPQRRLKFVHVAGTNGKGSTCAMVASVLEAAGCRVGLNTSPYLEDFRERIRVNGEMITGEDLGRLTAQLRPVAEAMEDHPTEFELVTAIALLYFVEQACDIVVMEVGMGGALDASNIIDLPEVAVLTAMSLDHTAQLGGTLADVAEAKAGIIKPGCDVVSLGGCPEADAVFRRVCREKGARLTEVDLGRLRVTESTLGGQRLDFGGLRELELPLTGVYQPRNAALALTALELLARKGWQIGEEAIRRGLAEVSWPGRMEVIQTANPAILLDGAHNPQGMAAAAESLGQLFPGKKVVLLTGVMADKAVGEMLDRISPLAKAAVTVSPRSPRAMGAEELRQQFVARGVPTCACVSAGEGLDLARLTAGPDGVVCVLGSLYLVGEVRQLLERRGSET